MSESTTQPRPKVYRTMKKDADGLPTVEPTASGLGVRPNTDITIDAIGNVLLDGKGMSVAPNWRDLPPHRIPVRLSALTSQATGSDKLYCFVTGTDIFQSGIFGVGLQLIQDKPTHATVAPIQVVTLQQYEMDLANTRSEWMVDEN